MKRLSEISLKLLFSFFFILSANNTYSKSSLSDTLKIKNRASNGSTGTFAFEEDIANKVSTKNIEITSNGGGILLKSPDGSVTRKIGIDNSGNLVVE